MDVGGSTAVVIDIGGGSVEVTLGTATHLTLGKSFKIGVIRLTERFVKTDPLSARDERRLVKHLNREMGAYLDQIAQAGFDRVIGTSGHDPEPRRAGARPTTAASRRRTSATSASAPRRCIACASGWSTPTSRSGCTCRASIRAAPT